MVVGGWLCVSRGAQLPDAPQLVPVRIPDMSASRAFCQCGARLVYHSSGVESGKPRMEFRSTATAGHSALMPAQKQLWFAEAGQSEERKITLSRARRGWQVEADLCARLGGAGGAHIFDQGVRFMTFTEMVSDSLAADSRRVAAGITGKAAVRGKRRGARGARRTGATAIRCSRVSTLSRSLL